MFGSDEPAGRRLDFLKQELNREANNLGSKSADSETTLISGEMKVLIEKKRGSIASPSKSWWGAFACVFTLILHF